MFKKKFKSLDKNYTAEIFLKKPDKYREIEKISSSLDNIITMGSCNSYTPASFKEDNVSIDLKKFNKATLSGCIIEKASNSVIIYKENPRKK